MGTLYLVRHGQASFGADDYDKLSPLGWQQAEALGRYWADRGMQFDAVIHGSLRRHVETWQGIAKGAGLTLDPLVWPGLNEYDSAAVIEAIHAEPLGSADTPEKFRAHFRLLRDGLAQWMAGTVTPKGMPPYVDFVKGITDALDLVRSKHVGRNVLLVSSGGPISTAVGHVLGLSPEKTIDLNMRIRNSAVTEFQFNPKRHNLVTYNTIPHLDDLSKSSWITYT